MQAQPFSAARCQLVQLEVKSGPRREKTCLPDFRQSEIQTSLLSYRDLLENGTFARSKSRYDTFHKVNNIGADQTAQMRRLVCACVVRKPPKTGFLATRPKVKISKNLKLQDDYKNEQFQV